LGILFSKLALDCNFKGQAYAFETSMHPKSIELEARFISKKSISTAPATIKREQ
jgi:hypothetical protein